MEEDKTYEIQDDDEITMTGIQLREWKNMIIEDFKKSDKYCKMLGYALKQFKDAQSEINKQTNKMEYWFIKALKLNSDEVRKRDKD